MTFHERLTKAAQSMPYHGVLYLKPNNLMCASSLSWFRTTAAGFYHVWANECKGVFVPQHGSMFDGFMVFPGV